MHRRVVLSTSRGSNSIIRFANASSRLLVVAAARLWSGRRISYQRYTITCCCPKTSSDILAATSALEVDPTAIPPTTMSSLHKPSPPFQPPSSHDHSLLNLDNVAIQLREMEEKRQRAYELGRQLSIELRKAQRSATTTTTTTTTASASSQAIDSIVKLIAQMSAARVESTSSAAAVAEQYGGSDVGVETPSIKELHPRTPRLANLNVKVEDWVRHEAFLHFLETGCLLPPSCATLSTSSSSNSSFSVTDEEYLGGACMGLAHDLHRYGLGRATVRDVISVQLACQLVTELHQYLLGMDFRNGPLRRKYDGVKYSLKGLETLLYELSVTGAATTTTVLETGQVKDSTASSDSPPHKKSRNDVSILPMNELLALQERMVHRDELRETLIKQCRDGQKIAKQSIFALHRGDTTKAKQLLQQCRDCIVNQLLPLVVEEPPLRLSGSLTSVMEEYAEAKLFAAWLHGIDKSSSNDDSHVSASEPIGTLLQPCDFDVELSLEEYFGGLCDLTGEIGRYAVQRGTARDVKGVQQCWQTNNDIWFALETLERLPQGIGKKMDALRISVEKLERMLYELSLSAAAGGRNVKSSGATLNDSTTDPIE